MDAAEYDFDSLEDIMSEQPGGPNYGRHNGFRLDESIVQKFDSFTDEEAGASRSWHIIWPGHGGTKGQLNILHEDEYVDEPLLRDMIEQEFGFSLEAVARVYSSKRLNAEGREERERMDARMLELYETGGNMFQFAEAIGLNQRTMNRAVVRARSVRESRTTQPEETN